MEKIIIKHNDSGQRLDKFLIKTFKNLPKSMMYKLIRKKRVKLNGKRSTGEVILNENDVLELYINDELLQRKTDNSFNGAGDLEVVYEDDNIIVAKKPVGVLSHGDKSGDQDHLVNRIKKYLFDRGEYNPSKENSFAPAICSRLDRNTGGIVLAAKSASALREANALIKERRIHKFYIAEVMGKLPVKKDVLKGSFVKDEKLNKMIYSDSDTAKAAVTAYEVLEENQGSSVLDIELITGRTHQIRAQFAHIGHPLVADKKYGGKSIGAGKYQALYAYKLVFDCKGSAVLGYLDGKIISVKPELLG